MIPVYNAEKYLDKCIATLLDQTLKEIEIILIDDFSTDSSREIMEKYNEMDKRIKTVYHSTNTGVSNTRNQALKMAKGEYIAFVDCDDFVAPNMYKKMYEAAIKNNADIVSTGYTKFFGEGKKNTKHPFPLETNTVINKEKMKAYLSASNKTKLLWYTWRNLFKRSLISDNKIDFDCELKTGEDSIFNLKAYCHSETLYVLEGCYYYYRDTPNSITSKRGKIYLVDSLIYQYQLKIALYETFSLGEAAIVDLSKNVVSHQLPMMISNEIILGNTKNNQIKNLLALPMMKNSLKRVSFLDRDFSRGIMLMVLLSKSKQYTLLWKLFSPKKNYGPERD